MTDGQGKGGESNCGADAVPGYQIGTYPECVTFIRWLVDSEVFNQLIKRATTAVKVTRVTCRSRSLLPDPKL